MSMTEAAEALDTSHESTETAVEGEAGEATEKKARTPRGNRWHAFLTDGTLLSVEHKNDLKKQLKTRPSAEVVSIVRGKVIPLKSKVTF